MLDDPVHAWDESFTMSLGLIRDAGGDPVAAGERLASSLSQTEAEKQAILRRERQYLRADRDRLAAAIDAFDVIATGLGLTPAASIETHADADRPSEPLDLVIAYRDVLVADRETLQARIADCRTAIDEEDVVAFGEQEVFKFRDQLRLSGVVVFDLPTLPDYADFPAPCVTTAKRGATSTRSSRPIRHDAAPCWPRCSCTRSGKTGRPTCAGALRTCGRSSGTHVQGGPRALPAVDRAATPRA